VIIGGSSRLRISRKIMVEESGNPPLFVPFLSSNREPPGLRVSAWPDPRFLNWWEFCVVIAPG